MIGMNFAFLIPFYNHPNTITQLVHYLMPFGIEILIVDDGSNAESKAILSELKGVRILTRDKNGGKGAAIKSGFALAKELGFSHILQIDADMQHDIEKIKDFLQCARENPKTLVCGNPKYGSDAPKSRLYGRKITSFWVYVNTFGGNLKDTMCGMRIYPLGLVYPLLEQCNSDRMDFDIEILLLAYKTGIAFKWIDVMVKYESGVSHFKGFRDNLLISKMHAKHFFLLPQFLWTLLVKR